MSLAFTSGEFLSAADLAADLLASSLFVVFLAVVVAGGCLGAMTEGQRKENQKDSELAVSQSGGRKCEAEDVEL